jgi:hypothetical protein
MGSVLSSESISGYRTGPQLKIHVGAFYFSIQHFFILSAPAP